MLCVPFRRRWREDVPLSGSGPPSHVNYNKEATRSLASLCAVWTPAGDPNRLSPPLCTVCHVLWVAGQVWRTGAHKRLKHGKWGSVHGRIGMVPVWIAEESPEEHLGLLGLEGRSAKREKSGLEPLGFEDFCVHGWGNGLVPDAPTRRD